MSELSPLTVPPGFDDERELYLAWLGYLRESVIRKTEGLDDAAARWTPPDALIPLLGIVVHLRCVEQRWIDGAMSGHEVSRDEAEFTPGPEVALDSAIEAYRRQGDHTDAFVRAAPGLDQPSTWGGERDLRWVVLHLLNETARHAGHADAVRELLDGTTG